MSYFAPELVVTMRDVLDNVVARLPAECATPAAKAYLAECILKAAAQGQTSYEALFTAAIDQVQTVTAMFS